MTNLVYYIALLLLIIIGVLLIKRVAGCLIKIVITLILLALFVGIYIMFFM